MELLSRERPEDAFYLMFFIKRWRSNPFNKTFTTKDAFLYTPLMVSLKSLVNNMFETLLKNVAVKLISF